MSLLRGLAGLYSIKPLHPVGADGRMALADHFRELRGRLLRGVTVIIVGTVIAMVFYDQLIQVVMGPYNDARRQLGESVSTVPTMSGVAAGMINYLKLSGLAALVVTSPLWLYQLWAFILPGLHPHERRWSRVFAAVAGPLFLIGVTLGYYTLPKGFQVLLHFVPDGFTNLVDFGVYLTFFSRTLLVFGVAFEIPVFVVLLNLAGVLSGKTLGAYRSWIIVGIFVFAAVATPSTDPFSMLLLAIPMVVLFLVSEVISRAIDRRRSGERMAASISDDAASEIDAPDLSLDRTSRLDDDPHW